MSLLRNIYYSLSPNMRFVVRKLVFLPNDVLTSLTGQRSKYEPPKGDIFIGSGDFIAQGKHQLSLLQKLAQLEPHHRALDIGSGIGRTAVALTTYLNASGSYKGFDVVEKGVDWCTSKITPDFPNFEFLFVDLGNDLYNKSHGDAKQFTFPYPDNAFDVSYLFSVFTHMKADEIAHYLKEIQRVLAPGGRCLATFFIYNDANEDLIATQDGFCFPVEGGRFRLMNEKVQSANIALHERYLDQIIDEAGLIKETLIEGYWKDSIEKQEGLDFQDVVVLAKAKE